MTEYTEELATQVCEGIAQGKSLVRVCNDLGVRYSSVYKWIAEIPAFKDNYTSAREAQADFLADAVLDVADDSSLPADDRRIKVDARKWYAGKLRPKKYGDKINVAGDEENPLRVVTRIERVIVDPENKDAV
jgi:hypothetical protein